MNENATPEADDAPENLSRRQLVNNLVIIGLVVVGIAGSAAMLYQLYGSGERAKPKAPKEGTAGAARTALPVAPRIASGFAVRLPAFSDVATAEDLRGKLGALQIPSTISVEAKVQVGPFSSREEAEAARARLKELGVYGGELVTIK